MRAAHHGLSGDLGHPGDPQDRAGEVPVRKEMGVDGARSRRTASCRLSSRASTARRARLLLGVPMGFLDGGVSGEGRARRGSRRCMSVGGEPAGGHPVGRVRPCGHAGARAGDPEAIRRAGRREPARGDDRARDHDPAVDHQGVGHGARGRAAGVRGRVARARRDAGGDLVPGLRPGGDAAASRRRSCWASAAPSARRWR